MLDQGTCVAQQRACHLVEELQQWNLHGPLKSQSHGEQTLRHDGDVDDRDDVLHLRDLDKFSELSGTRAPVVAHNGHDNLVQEQHLAQFALCIPAVLSARTAGASRCMKQRRQPPSKNCNSGN